MQPLQEGRPIDFHTSNIQRAQTEQRSLNIVRLGNPIRRSARRAFLAGCAFGEWYAESKCLFCATALFRSPAPLFSPFFSGKTEKNGPPEAQRAIPAQKRYGPRSGGCGSANRTAPPAHSKHVAGGIPRHSGAHEITPLPVRKMAHRRPCRIQTPSK